MNRPLARQCLHGLQNVVLALLLSSPLLLDPALAQPADAPAEGSGGDPTAPAVSSAKALEPEPPAAATAATTAGSSPQAWTWADDGLLPFPSDLYTVEDPTTATGRRVRLPEQIYDETLLSRAPFDAPTVFERVNGMDGFSANMPMLVGIPAGIDPSILPTISGSTLPVSPVQLIDLDHHRRVPIRVRALDRKGRGSTLLVIQPEDRLHNTHRYAVVVSRALTDRSGRPIPPPEGFVDALRGSASSEQSARAAHARALGEALALEGVDLSSVTLAFRFTVESDGSFWRPMQALDAKVERRREETPYRVAELRIRRRILKGSSEAAFVGRGRFEALQFIDERGRLLDEPRTHSLSFLLEMPAECPPGGCAVAIFGHGLGVTRESMFQVADRFAERGIATIGVAAPWHGNLVSPMKVILGTRRNLDLLHGLFVEHIMRNVQLVEVVRQGLAGQDLGPGRTARHGGPALTLRADQLFYIGQSMGGICGVATTALAPDIKAAVYDVAGGAGVDLLFDSWVAKMMRLPNLEFRRLGVRDSDRLMPLAAYLFNDFDPLGFAPYVTTSPRPGERPRLVTQQVGLGDGLVPNWTSEKLGRALGLEVIRPAEQAAALEVDREGPGLRYFRFSRHWFLAHISLMWPGSSRAAADFFTWSRKQIDPSRQAGARLPPGE